MRRRLRRVRWLLPVVVVAGVVAFYFWRRAAGDEAVPLRTAKVERRDVVVAVSAVGVLEPLTTVEVKANVAGEIVELAVDRGDWVAAQDLIARVDPTETRSAYDQAQADVAAALARVQESMAELERQERLTPAQIRAAEDALEAASARTKQAESTLAYQRKTTAADIRRAQEALAAAEARLHQAEALAKAQPELTQAAIEQATAELRAAEEARKRLVNATQPQERATAKSQIEAARIARDNDAKALKRLRDLHAQGFVAQQQVEDAEKALADSDDRFESAKAAYDTLDQKHATERKEAQATVERAQAALSSARTGEVEDQVAQQELEAAKAAVREAEAALAAAEASKQQDEVRLQELRAAKAAADEARSQLAVAKAGALQAQVSAHQVAQARAQTRRSAAQLENARKNLAYTTIRAPRSGLVIDRFVEEGTVITSGRSAITQGTSIVTLADVSRMFVLAEVDEADIGQVALGQLVAIEVETFEDEVFPGKVTQIYPRGEEIENVTIFRVRIELDDPDPRLRPGMTAEASIMIERSDDVLAAPNEAFYQQQGKTFAEVVEDGEIEEVEVETGIASFEWTEVKAGLEEGQEVVIGSAGPWMGQEQPPGSGGSEDRRRQQRRMMFMGGRRR